MAQVLEDVLEEQYEGIQPDSPFAVLVDTLSAGRDDSRLAQIVLDVFGRIQSHPHPGALAEGAAGGVGAVRGDGCRGDRLGPPAASPTPPAGVIGVGSAWARPWTWWGRMNC